MTISLPEPGDRGRIGRDVVGALDATVAAWDAFLAALPGVDWDAPTRKDDRSVARVLAVLGSWAEGRPLGRLREDALAGRLQAEPLSDIDARVVAAHADDSPDAIRAALTRARDEIRDWSRTPDCAREAVLPVGGPLGVVPLGTMAAASAYQLAVAARDLAPAGLDASPDLIDAGLVALIDSVGAVAAASGSATDESPLVLTVDADRVVVRVCAIGPDWGTEVISSPDPGASPDTRASAQGPAVRCSPEVLIDVASGRSAALVAYARGSIEATDLPGLLRVVTMLASAPGLPGTEGLRSALGAYAASARAADSVTRAVGGAWRRLRGQ